MERILDRFAVTSQELADHLEIPERQVVALLDHLALAPLVVLDGEDAQRFERTSRRRASAARPAS